MKSTIEHIEEIRIKLTEQIKAKEANAQHFKQGGSISDFKPTYTKVSRPF